MQRFIRGFPFEFPLQIIEDDLRIHNTIAYLNFKLESQLIISFLAENLVPASKQYSVGGVENNA